MERKVIRMRKFATLEEVKKEYPIDLIVFSNTKPSLEIIGYFYDGEFYYPMYHDRFEGYQILEEDE